MARSFRDLLAQREYARRFTEETGTDYNQATFRDLVDYRNLQNNRNRLNQETNSLIEEYNQTVGDYYNAFGRALVPNRQDNNVYNSYEARFTNSMNNWSDLRNRYTYKGEDTKWIDEILNSYGAMQERVRGARDFYTKYKDAGDYYRSLMGTGQQTETPEQPETPPAGPYNRDYFDSQNQQEQMDALDEYMMRNQTETPPAAPVPGSRVPAEPDRRLRLAWGGATDFYFGPLDFSTEEQKAAGTHFVRRLQAQDDMVEPLAAYYQALQQDRTIGDRTWQQSVLHPELRGFQRPTPAGSALPKPKTSAGMDWVLGKRDDMQKQLDATARKGGQWGQGWYDLVGMDDATIEQTLQAEIAKVDGGAGNKPLVSNIKEYYTWNRAAGGKARLLEIEQELAQIDEEKRRFTELSPGKFGNTAEDDAYDAANQMEVLTTRLQDPYLTDEQRQAVQAELEAARTTYLNANNQYAEFDNRRQALVQEQNVLQAVTSGNSRNEEGAELRANDPDFNARAMYKTENNFDSLVASGNIKDRERLDAAFIYQYLSGRGFNPVNVPDAAFELSSYADLLGQSQNRVSPENYGLDYLTPYEKKTFEYKYNVEGQQSAMDWLDGMSEILMYRRAVQNQKNWAEFTKSSGWAAAGATALRVPANIYKAVMTPFRAIHQLRGGSVWDPINDDVRFVSTVSDTAGKMLGEWGPLDFNIPLIDKNAGELIYGVVMSMADVLASRGISQSAGVEGISMFILGSSAASDGMYNAAMSGKGATESVAQGVLSGLIEALTEEISWKSLQGLNTVGRKSLAREIARRMAFQGITESGEEAIASLANMGISVLMYGIEDSDFGDLKKQVAFDAGRNNETLTDEELTTRALLRFAQDAGADAFSGLLSGVSFGAGSLATQQGRADIVTENILAKFQYESQNGAEMPGMEAPVIAPAPGVSAEQQEIGNELVAIAMGVDPDLAEEIKAEFQKPMNSTQLAEASGKVSQAILRAEQGMQEPAEQSARQPAQQPVRPTDPALTEQGMWEPAQAQEAAPYQPPVPATQNQVSTALAYQAQIDEAIARKEEAIRRRDAAVRRLGKVKQAVVQDQLAKWGQMDAEYTELQDLRQRISDLQAIQPADFYVPEVAQEVQAVEAEMDRLGIPREVVRPADPALTEPAMQAPEQAMPIEAPARPIDPALTEQGILPPQQPEAVKPLKTAPARPVDPALTERFNQLVEQRITPQIEALGKTETRTAGEERAEAAQGPFVPARVESVEIGGRTLEYRTLPVDETVYNEQREKNSDLDDGAYSLAFQTAYVAGLSGSRSLLESSSVIKGLDAETAEAAYKAGQEAIKKGMALGPKAKPVPGLLAKGAGRVRMLADVAKMDAPQKKMAAALSQFSRAMGLNVEIYMSKPNADGVFTEEQGSYNPRTGVFRFDINAGINTQAQSENAVIAAMTYALPRVMGHEFTHFLKTQSPELFQKYQESLLQKLVEKDVDLDERIRSKLARSTHGALSMDVALEEVIADGSEMMLQDSTAFADVLKADQNLWQKFKKWLADFTKTMQAQLRRIGPGFAESAATMEVVNGVLKVADDLQQQYDAMLREAFKGRPAQAAPAMVEDSNADTQDAGVKFQMREPVEKTARLIAVHNLNELKLSASIESGGFPMPSIALIKEGQGHDMYGDISVVFGRETIDPQADKRNAVYSSDGWTPVHTGQQEGASLDQVLDDMLKDQLRSNVPEVIDAVEQYASVDEMKNKSSRLGKVDNYDEIKENLSKKFNDVVAAFDKSKNPFGKQNRRFFIAESLRGLLQRGATTVDDIQREMAFYDSKSTPIDASRENAQKFYDLLQEIYNIPTGYFEAKPERVVGAGEVRAAIHPNTTSKSLVDSMKRMGWRLLEYEAGNSQDRLDKLNSLEDVLFSERDSEGRQLTPEQAEFFKDSKVRDENGNLLRVYHGTKANFTTFRATDGAYFTASKKVADGFAGGAGSGAYYLDFKTPLVLDAEGNRWDALTAPAEMGRSNAKYKMTPAEEAQYTEFRKLHEALQKLVDDGLSHDDYTKWHENNPRHWELQPSVTKIIQKQAAYEESNSSVIGAEDLVEWAKEQGKYDGVIIKNVREGWASEIISDDYIALHSEQVKSVDNLNPTSSPDIRYSERAPIFYSKMQREIEALKGDKFAAGSLIQQLRNKGVKADEIRWSGIAQWLTGKKSVTKEELAEFAKGNELRVEEVPFYDPNVELVNEDERKFQDYTLDGGTNYREILFTVPDLDGTFQSQHWDEKNVLAHTRLQDFTTEDGEPVLFVEEVQSDWHEKGREQGYGGLTQAEKDEMASLTAQKVQVGYLAERGARESGANTLAQMNAKEQALREWENSDSNLRLMTLIAKDKQISPAPFTTTWHEFVLKRVLRMAAENGQDYVAWTTGKMQADRYSLEKHISKIEAKRVGKDYYPEPRYGVSAFDLNGRLVPGIGSQHTKQGLVSTYGKDVADKIIQGGESPDGVILSGLDLKIGGEGMKAFYDIGGKSSQNIPRFLSKYAAQWGAKVQEITLETGDVVPAVEVNERMKESVLYEGQPMYSERDSTGSPLTPEQAEFFRDSKVRDGEGRLQVLYHQTGSDFTEFDPLRKGEAGQFDSETPSGIFMKPTPADIGLRGKKQMRLYANIANPLEVADRADLTAFYRANIPGYAALEKSINDIDKKYEPLSAEAEKRGTTWYLENYDDIVSGKIPEADVEDALVGEWGRLLEKWKTESNEVRARAKVLIDEFFSGSEYDGVFITRDAGSFGRSVKTYIAFTPEQVKNTDNLAPTSSPDIRFAERDPENALPSPRAILAGAFGNVAVTEAEKKRVEQYKRGADRYNRVEKALRGLEAERRKLYTQGGTAEQKADNRRGIEELKDQLNKADRVLLGLENSQPLRDLVAREREKAERTIREREKKRSAEYREQVRERSKAAADKRIAKDKERREQKESRAKHRQSIHKLTKELAEWTASPSGKKHVPEVLRGAIGEFLLSINEQSKRAAIGGRDTAEDRRFYDRLDALNKALQRVQKFQNDDAGQFVDDVYEGVSGFLDLPAEFTERLAEILTQVKGIIDSNPGEHVLALMDNEALAALDEAMTALKTAVGQMNGLIGNRFAQTADEIGKMTMEEMKALKSRLAKKGLVHRFMNWENILPVYAFDRFGKAGKAMMQNFIDGFHKMSKNAQAIVDFSEKTFKEKEARAWGKDVRTFVVDGNEIQMSVAHVMSVWALMNREQAVGHILGGGIRIADFKVGNKNYVDAGHVLTKADVDAMLATLEPRQREVAKALQGFMSTTGSAWGNEVSMTRFGVKLFGEENYFPIQSVRENMDERMDSAEGNPLYRLLNLAMTKPLTKNANNQILVGNIFDVFAAHMSDMAQYNALALPVLNALKWYNYRESYKNRDGQKRVESVRGAIRNAHGDAGLNYIYRLMSDINGSRMTGGGEAFAMNSLRRFNRAAVAANLRVMLLQPTSIIRAHNVIDARYLTGGALRNMARMRSNIREMEQYSGIAGWKQMGFYDVNLSRSLQEMIKRDNSLLDRATEKTMALPQAMDRITWAAIWNGAKMQVAAQNPGMDKTSAEYFDKVRDLFDQAIYRTQVVDSMLTRSDFMRRPSGTAKAFSSFMSEPTMTYNILASQVHALNDDIASGMSMGAAWKKNGRKITRTITTWALSAALVTMVEALSGAWRDDDEYDTFKEKFDKALRTNALDNFMPINLPIVSDLWEIAKRGAGQAFNLDLRAYESNNPFLASYELVADGVNAVAGYLDGSNKKITEYGAAYAALRALSSLTGHPFSGATREVVDLWNNTVGTMYPQYRVTRYEPTKAGGINKLFQGLVDGDAERVAELRATLERQGVDDKDVNEGLRRNIRAEIDEGRLAPEEGMKRLVEWGGLVETSPTIKGWLADGLIDDEQAETLLKTYWKDDPKEIYRLMDKWENGTDTDGDGDIDYSVNDRFTQAVRTGTDLRAVIAEYLDPEKFGSTKSSLSTAITTTFKDEYVAATPAERSRLKGYLLNAYVLLGYDRNDMNKKIDGWLKK